MTALGLVRAGAVLLWVAGFGFGIPCIMAIRSVLAGRGIIFLMGFPTYGQGPFEARGIATTAPLLLGFLAVCALEVVAGRGLWTGHLWGAYLAFALLIPGMAYWWGFALPFGPIFAVASAGLVIVGWRGLG